MGARAKFQYNEGMLRGWWVVGILLAGCPRVAAEPRAPLASEARERDEGAADERSVEVMDADRDGVVAAEDACPDAMEVRNEYLDGDGCPDEVPPELAALLGVVPGISFKHDR